MKRRGLGPPLPLKESSLGLGTVPADDLETQWQDFKPWQGPKEDMKVAVEYAACFANAEGAVLVFVGIKMTLAEVFSIPPVMSLAVTAGLLGLAVGTSLWRTRAAPPARSAGQ